MGCYLKKLFSLKGQVAAVTGKSTQLSQAIANNLSKSGAEVYDLNRHCILTAKSNQKSNENSAKTSDRYVFSSLCQELSKKQSRLNIVVNCLGIALPFNETKDILKQQECFHKIIKHNLDNTIDNTQIATKLMKKHGFSSVINIIHFMSNSKYCNHSDYVSVQNSLNIITKKWASNLIKDNVRVNNLVLVNVKDKIKKEQAFSEYKKDEEDSLMGTIIFLASYNSLHVTGQNIFHFYRC